MISETEFSKTNIGTGRARRVWLPFLFCALNAICFFGPAQAEIDVSLSGRTERIGSFSHGEIVYFSLSEFVELYGEKLSWETLGQSIDYRIGDNRFRFFLGSSFVSLNDTVRNMTYPAKLREGALYLPAQTFVRLLDRTRPERVTWESDRRRIRIETGYYNITDVTVSQKANGILVEIYLTEELPFQLTESEGNWLNFSLPGGRVNRAVIESRRSSAAIREINAFQFETSAQVSLRLRRTPHSYDAKYNPETGRIQLSIRNPNFRPQTTHRPVGQIGPDKTIDLIVIDPGHGGEDNGAIGRKFTKEKDIALKISRELAKLIRKDKLFKVILTREKDEFITLEERAGIANLAQADLFISIHVNANISRQARGSQVFFLAPAKNDGARALAQAENASFLTNAGSVDVSGRDDLSLIVNDMIQNVYEEVSADLSAIIQNQFQKSLGIPSRGVDQAAFVVLNQVYMPSVLVEVAFISNRQEEKLLRDKKFRRKAARAIYEGLKRFKRKYERSP